MQPIEIHDRGRGPELKGTRITVYDIIPYRLDGRSATYIAAVLGRSTPEIEALFRYMDEHYEEVMAVHGILSSRDFYPISLSAIRNCTELSLFVLQPQRCLSFQTRI